MASPAAKPRGGFADEAPRRWVVPAGAVVIELGVRVPDAAGVRIAEGGERRAES